MLPSIKSIRNLLDTYPTQQDCFDLLENVLWADGIISPFDKDSQVYRCANRKYRCRNTGKYFNVLKGTMFEASKIELRDWFMAIWMLSTNGSGMTSVDLAKDLGVTQKTAWFMLHRIRACVSFENENVVGGIVECDETFIGGKNKNRHKSKKFDYSNGETEKIPVLGMLSREGKINCKVIPNRAKESIQPVVMKYVSNGSQLITDEHSSYSGLEVVYNHRAINHSAYEYVNLDDKGLHNQNIESSWRVLKRSVSGKYVRVAPKHLQVYVDEFVYRFNTRDLTQSDKFYNILANCNVRTKIKDLVGKEFIKSEIPVKIFKGTAKAKRPLDKPNFKKLK